MCRDIVERLLILSRTFQYQRTRIDRYVVSLVVLELIVCLLWYSRVAQNISGFIETSSTPGGSLHHLSFHQL